MRKTGRPYLRLSPISVHRSDHPLKRKQSKGKIVTGGERISLVPGSCQGRRAVHNNSRTHRKLTILRAILVKKGRPVPARAFSRPKDPTLTSARTPAEELFRRRLTFRRPGRPANDRSAVQSQNRRGMPAREQPARRTAACQAESGISGCGEGSAQPHQQLIDTRGEI